MGRRAPREARRGGARRGNPRARRRRSRGPKERHDQPRRGHIGALALRGVLRLAIADAVPDGCQGRNGHAPALPLASIHPSAWKGNSANFVLRGFSEVRKRKDSPRIALWANGPFLTRVLRCPPLHARRWGSRLSPTRP